MIHIKAFDHIVLRAKNPKTMIQFYCQVLGCTIEKETTADFGLTQLRANSFLIDIVAVDSILGKKGGKAPTSQSHNVDHFCVQIDPFSEDELRTYLAKHNITAGPIEKRYGAQGEGLSIYIQDPEGNTIELKASKGTPKR